MELNLITSTPRHGDLPAKRDLLLSEPGYPGLFLLVVIEPPVMGWQLRVYPCFPCKGGEEIQAVGTGYPLRLAQATRWLAQLGVAWEPLLDAARELGWEAELLARADTAGQWGEVT